MAFNFPIILAAAAEPAGNPFLDLLNRFHVEWPLLLAQAINFCVVAFLLYRFAFKPIIATIDERRARIDSGLKYAEEMKTKLAESEAQQEAALRKALLESQQIVQEARDNAKSFTDKQREETAAAVQEMLEKGRRSTELERERILSEVRREIAGLVVQTSRQVLMRELTDADKTRLSEAASREIGQIAGSSRN